MMQTKYYQENWGSIIGATYSNYNPNIQIVKPAKLMMSLNQMLI